MGPITLFDKSFLQSLSLDESVWFDNFFLINIPPLFFIETLADLEKSVRAGRTPEQEVGIIADKTPEMHSRPNTFHIDLCSGNLLGYDVEMKGRIAATGGMAVKTADKSGVVFKEPPEIEALNRWQKSEFLEVERQIAKFWRRMLNSLDLKEAVQGLKSIGINPSTCKTLEEAKSIAESIINKSGYSLDQMTFFFLILNIPKEIFPQIFRRWASSGSPSLKTFAPYVAFVLTIEIFFYVSAAAGLISPEKVSNKVDVAYLFYLPFCMIFVSTDRLHKKCAPLFMRDNQQFVWGPELKEDLNKIDIYYDRLPESEKKKGVYAIAVRPPSADFLVSQLWDRFLPNWRSLPKQFIPRKQEEDKKLIQQITEFVEAKPTRMNQVDIGLSNADAMVIQRRIRKKKGKWWQVPHDLENEK